MKTAYEILDVSEQASDNEIKQAYLQKVKQYPPDHHHNLFQQIHGAYQTIKDQKSRLNYELFDYPEADFNILLDQALVSSEALTLSADSFDKLLRASIDDSIFQFSTTHKINNT
ncbi:J domain-containing protein [Crenothrix sp.]|uniref:J domain-containing protein n=1 Tax=Crenothrix sp. TaxID=3100433 RepID=UPI00374D955E